MTAVPIARTEPMPMQFPATPHFASEIEDAIEELVACVDDPTVEINGHADSYCKCVEAMWQAGWLITEYMAKRLGMTPLQQSMAMDRLYGVHVMNRPAHHRPEGIANA